MFNTFSVLYPKNIFGVNYTLNSCKYNQTFTDATIEQMMFEPQNKENFAFKSELMTYIDVHELMTFTGRRKLR